MIYVKNVMRVKEIPSVDDYDANFRVFFSVLLFYLFLVVFFVYVAGVTFFVRNTHKLVKRKEMMDVKNDMRVKEIFSSYVYDANFCVSVPLFLKFFDFFGSCSCSLACAAFGTI